MLIKDNGPRKPKLVPNKPSKAVGIRGPRTPKSVPFSEPRPRKNKTINSGNGPRKPRYVPKGK